MAARLVRIDGHRLECRRFGPPPNAAPTLVFLHEGLGSASQWRDFPEALSLRTDCGGLVYSRLGYGQSDPVEGPRSVRFMHEEASRVLPQVLERFDIGRYFVVGHSDGGSIAIVHAAAATPALAGLILEAPHTFVEDLTIESIREARERWTTTDLRQKLARHHAHVDSMFESWTDVWLRPEFRDWSIREYLRPIRCPALVLQGEDDEYGTVKQVDVIEAEIGGECEAVILPACGHAPHVDQRAIVEDAMARFVRHALVSRGNRGQGENG